jgi:organic radical activating enzyme
MRDGMNDGLGMYKKTSMSGPARLDIKFDLGCNLACRTCGPELSTFWQKHLKENNLWNFPIISTRDSDKIINILKQLDLQNLRQVVFCGGETLLGNEYWNVAQWIIENIPDAKNQLTLCFQTNGTQPLSEKNYKIIEKVHLVKMHFSIDGIKNKFEYLRWPADWDQTIYNIFNIRDNCPSNVMFVVEETVSIFNLMYLDESSSWMANNFATNREADVVNHTKHSAFGIYSLNNCSQEYVDLIKQTRYSNLIPGAWQENPNSIKNMLKEIKKFDVFRNQSFVETFPEVADMYSRFW